MVRWLHSCQIIQYSSNCVSWITLLSFCYKNVVWKPEIEFYLTRISGRFAGGWLTSLAPMLTCGQLARFARPYALLQVAGWLASLNHMLSCGWLARLALHCLQFDNLYLLPQIDAIVLCIARIHHHCPPSNGQIVSTVNLHLIAK
jgi:hypothetical protein